MQIEPVGSSVDTKINNENKGICMYVCVCRAGNNSQTLVNFV